MIADTTGVVNAGGRGTRLGGARKAFLRFANGTTLLERTLALFGDLFPARAIVANEREPYAASGVPVLGDRIADRGAPGGLHAALAGAATPWIFFAACDMPALDRRVVEALAEARTPGAQASVAIVDGRPEPLHAFWARAALPTLERLLREGEPSFRDVLASIPHAGVPLEELERRIPGARASFSNVNTPEDLARFSLALPE